MAGKDIRKNQEREKIMERYIRMVKVREIERKGKERGVK